MVTKRRIFKISMQFIYLFVVSLTCFLGNSDYIASNEKKIGELLILKRSGRRLSWPNLRHYPGSCLKGLRKTSARTAEI
jgi:hypothetical protein